MTSPPARGELPSAAPRAARCPFHVPFPGGGGALLVRWGRAAAREGGRRGAGSGLGGRSGTAGKPCGGSGLCGPRLSHRAGRVIRSPRRRRRVRGSGGALSRARLPTHAAAPGLWRREGAGSPPAAPGPGPPRPPQAASGSAGRAAGPSLAPPAPLAATRPAGPGLGARRGIGAGGNGRACGRWEGPGAGSWKCRARRP